MGYVSPFAANRADGWQAVLSGERCVRRLLPADLHGQWPVDTPVKWVGAPISAPRAVLAQGTAQDTALADPLYHWLRLAVLDALDSARITSETVDRRRLGCVVGTSKGGLIAFANAYRHLLAEQNRGPARPLSQTERPVDWQQSFPHSASRFVAQLASAHGPCLTPVAACATGLVSVLRGVDLIREGLCDVVLAGAADASLHPAVLASFARMGVLAKNFDDPATACRPFNVDRDGFAVGEGAAVFVLERDAFAHARGARPLARVAAGTVYSETSGLTSLDPGSETLSRLIQTTLQRAGLSTEEIGHVNLHGTGTVANDLAEAIALKAVFGARSEVIPAYAAKGAMGHLLGAAGAVELAFSVEALAGQVLPPTVNLVRPDPSLPLNFSSTARTLPSAAALKLSLGFGGTVAAICLLPP